MTQRRDVDIVVISDVHLGTPACRAEELLTYLKSINPGKLVLNGDIIDMQQFSARYWPDLHTRVVRRILKFAAHGTPVFYITGNHEQALRRYSNAGFGFGRLHLVDRLEWIIDGQRTLFVHGDECDSSLDAGAWLIRFGSWAYDRIERIGNMINSGRRLLGRRPVAFAKTIKHRFSHATEYIDRFESECAKRAVLGGYDAIVCGHIHHPIRRAIPIGDQRPAYLNSGDWVENCSALEYQHGTWSVVRYDDLVESGDLLPGWSEETRAVV